MPTSKSRKKVRHSALEVLRFAPTDCKIPARLGGGVLKEFVEQEIPSGKLRRYALAYINPAIYAGDNGRVLGYDNAHGFPHRHFMGIVTVEPALTWDEIRAKFDSEWKEIAAQFVNERKQWRTPGKRR
jgi:hypothetical protein